MKKTIKELKEIDNLIGDKYAKDKNLQNSKFGYAYKKFAEKNFYPKIKELKEKIENARVDNALEDPKTRAIINDETNPRGFAYSRDGLQKVINEERKLDEEFKKEEVEIEPYFCKKENLPELTEEEIEKLKGCIIE